MTTTLQKTEVKTTWPVTKIQEEVAGAMMRNMLLTFKVVEKAGPQVLKDWFHAFTTMKVDYYKAHGVKNPLDLVKAMSEFETNVFGSQMSFWGDDKVAHVEYTACGMWNAMEKMGLPKEQVEAMGKNCAENTNALAQAFGFTGEIKIGEKPGEACCTMTFTRK
jgi:hypothetical protein